MDNFFSLRRARKFCPTFSEECREPNTKNTGPAVRSNALRDFSLNSGECKQAFLRSVAKAPHRCYASAAMGDFNVDHIWGCTVPPLRRFRRAGRQRLSSAKF